MVEKGLVSSRTRAEEVISTHGVLVNRQLVNKSSLKVSYKDQIELVQSEIPYVSKGALKLKKALDFWGIVVKDKIFIDLGASTGGFSQILLENDIEKIYAVDVGKGQLHPKIKSNVKVINLDQTHAKDLSIEQIPEKVDGIVIDVSFISAMKVIGYVRPFLKDQGIIILLIKPQFELGKTALDKHGVVKNHALYPSLLNRISEGFREFQLNKIDCIESPILGGNGNKEFLAYFCAANE